MRLSVTILRKKTEQWGVAGAGSRGLLEASEAVCYHSVLHKARASSVTRH